MDILGSVKEVILAEQQALKDLHDTVDQSTVAAVEMIVNCQKKLVISGMGKSGHIARKIAATFSSTGTLAIFMHPAEGMHGDLGVVEKGDVVILLSHSGESDEMIGLLPSLKQISCKIIVVTGNLDSTLANHCDVVICTPVKKEACALNLAPTSSTTAALTIGDALAVTAMKIKEFSRQDFALFHPAGRIGKRLLYKVDDLMKTGDENPIVKPEDSFDEVVSSISKGLINAVTVVDDQQRIKGLITGFDLRASFQNNADLKVLKAKDMMFKTPTTINKGTYAVKAYELMKNSPKPLNVLPVLENEKVIGMLALQDMIRSGL
ncbi:MAG: KpsF/GutQ family sugar-phosphate isomerase [Deltaproteobacteria bacterium]|jgi:arabinose-5-phosphate isomerase|nr:KpsF/GutQ family sugar-phosphate isomerase [Deltaproteobacteria bacterium]MBT4525620.1 KpsF/GutQ family sugar-phosphate isomerase [Deltaproteobacteria bacterium]